MNSQKLNLEVSNAKRQKVLAFVNKRHEKRITSFAGFGAKLQQSIDNNEEQFIYYATKKIIPFVTLLRDIGVVQSFYVMTTEEQRRNFSTYLSPAFDARILVVYLKSTDKYAPALRKFRLFTIPSRPVTISNAQLLKKTLTTGAGTLYVLNTSQGLLTHKTALHQKIGGEVVCEIQ